MPDPEIVADHLLGIPRCYFRNRGVGQFQRPESLIAAVEIRSHKDFIQLRLKARVLIQQLSHCTARGSDRKLPATKVLRPDYCGRAIDFEQMLNQPRELAPQGAFFALAPILDLLRNVLPIEMLDTVLSQGIDLILHPRVVVAVVELSSWCFIRMHPHRPIKVEITNSPAM